MHARADDYAAAVSDFAQPISSNPVDVDIAAIEDEGLRKRIASAFEELRNQAQYGLVYEKHRPESVVLYTQQIAEDGYATTRNGNGHPGTTYRVASLDGDTATLLAADDKFRPVPVDEKVTRPAAELVPVMKFGTPIFPGLVPTGEVLNGGDKPFHTVINGENFHALETLLYAYEGKADCIYIDPPYNTGAADWKYNNDYIDKQDRYRHSKWLSFMEKRLRLAKRLLNPENSVLIVTIDEKEVHRLGLLLEQVFKNARAQMVSVAINPAPPSRNGLFGRADEYYFYCLVGSAGVQATMLGDDWITSKGRTHRGEIRWDLLRKSGASPTRAGHPDTFYAFFITDDGKRIHSVGEPIGVGASRHDVVPPTGTFAAWPIRQDNTEGRWRLQPSTARQVMAEGGIRLGALKGESTPIYYLSEGERAKIVAGVYEVTGYREDGSAITSTAESIERTLVPGTQWRISSHDSTQYGSRLLAKLLPGRKFDYPKSLYAVEDALRFVIADKPDALVIDFFSGSGTTAHAAMRLNRQDGGRRRSIMVTNNEVSVEEQTLLRQQGLHPGHPEWEKLGICEYITKPRVRAVITGKTASGDAVKGDYKFIDEFPMADGFEENARFFDLVYLDPESVEAKQSFKQIAHLLWLIGGAEGSVILAEPRSGWALPTEATYGVLFRNRGRAPMAQALRKRDADGLPVRHVFIVSDSTDEFVRSREELGVTPENSTRLYRDYLKNFRTNVTDTQGT